MRESRCRWTTPLDIAATAGKVGVVRYLVAHGAAINAVDSDGYTPLMNAVLHAPYPQGPAVVKYLVAAGARMDIAGKDGMTALMLAAAYGNLDAVRYLLEGHATINANQDGDTALHFAARWNATVMADRFSAHKLSIEKKLKCSLPPPLDFTAFQRTERMIDNPIPGVSLPTPDLDCHCAEISAVSCAKLRIVQALVAHHALVNETDHFGMTEVARFFRTRG